MTNLSVKKNDTVVVIAGKDAGKKGKVLAVNAKTNRVIVEGVNIVSRHTKARKAQEKSQIVKKEAAIDVSNIMVVCPTCGKPTRVKHSEANGKKVRVCKCGAVLDKKFVADKKAEKTEKAAAKKNEKVEKAEKADVKKETVKKVKATSTSSKAAKLTTGKKSQRGV